MPVCHPVTVRQGITLHIKQSGIQTELSFSAAVCARECVGGWGWLQPSELREKL